MNRKYLLLTLWAILLPLLSASAQQVRLYTAEDGLPGSLINAVEQDSRGYIWISTENGLAYFDGMNFTNFHHVRSDEGALASNLVLTVYEDSRQTLWVGSSAPQFGLQRFDYESNTFHDHPLRMDESLSAGMHISSIVETPDHEALVVATSGRGLYLLRMSDYSEMKEASDALNLLLPSLHIIGLTFDSKGRLWVLSEESGLSLIDYRERKSLPLIWHEGLRERADEVRISSLVEEPVTGKIIIGTLNCGLLVYDEEQIRPIAHDSTRDLSVKSLCLAPASFFVGEGGIFVGAEHDGLLLFDPLHEQVRPLQIPNCRYDLSRGKVHALTYDSQGNLWVGLYQRGLMVLPKPMYGFEQVAFSDRYGDGWTACVTSVLATRTGDVWVGTDGDGVYVVRKDGSRSHYTMRNSALENNAVMAMSEDEEGVIRLSTYMGGLVRWRAGEGFRKIAAPEPMSLEKVMNFAYDEPNHRLYMGTYGEGVLVLDTRTDAIRPLSSSGMQRWIGSLCLDRQGLLWIGSFYGMQCYDTKSRALMQYNMGEIAVSSRIYSCCESAKTGVLWIGSGEGLVSFDRKSGSTRHYTEDDGLPGNVINAIAEAADGTLWISTCNGLSRLNPDSGQFKNYYAEDGLQSNEFRYGAVATAADGRLYFGGINGLTALYPHIVEQGQHAVPPITFSRLKVFNREVTYDPASDENILDKHISQATRVTLAKEQNVFDIEFSVLEYTNPHKVVYAYRMEGFDSEWHYTDSDNRVATYTNLPDGHYTFAVKAFFEGEESDEAAYRSLAIRILPPWWRSWWAKLSYAVVVALAIAALAILVSRHRSRLRERRESEKKDMKLRMFTDFSHEIRTPLSLVISPLRQLRSEENDPKRRELYNLMYRNSLRIQRLVNQLMDIRKIDNGKMRLNYFRSDLIFFVRDIMHSFDHAALSKRIEFTLNSECEELEVWIDQSNFDKILFNILSNAFKFTPEGGRVSLHLTTHENDRRSGVDSSVASYVELRIENTGSEIDPRHLEHIFDRFFQIESSGHFGSGVGLHLTQKLVELHRGTITAENTGTGVAFVLRLPLGNEHLSPDEILLAAKHKDLYQNLRAEQPSEAVEGLDYAEQSSTENENKTSRTKRNVVVVDDDREMGRYLKMSLAPSYNVEVYTNGKEAWKAISATLPDAIVTDLVMPEMGGLELCRKIKQNFSTNHIPVLILTSQTDDETVQLCMDSGADRYLSKPVSLELLKGGIAQAIATRDTIRNKYRNEVDAGLDEVKMGSTEDTLVSRVVEVIRKHIEEPDFSVDDLSREVGMSRVHLNRKLKENISTSPSNLMKTIRLKQAAFLLINHKVNISEVAYKVGFSTHSYFSNSFRDYFGMTPKEFVLKYANCTDEEMLRKFFE
ncbi:MAG: response regulator [Alistipes sp.]|nr:response regulator [Alistipes sp.]